MKKQIKLALLPLLFSMVGWAFPQSAQAQFLGYTSPQTTTSYPFGSSSFPCTASLQNSAPNMIQNVGQSAHYVYLFSTDITQGFVTLQGSNDGTNYANISDRVSIQGNGFGTPAAFVVGSGYYNFVRVSLACNTGGHFIAQYSGTSVTPGQLFGDQQISQYYKSLLRNGNALAGFTSFNVQPAFGSTAGFLNVSYNGGVAPTGSTVTVTCLSTQIGNSVVFNNVITGAAGNQFAIPAQPCSTLFVGYSPGSGGSGTVNLTIEYVFTFPGLLANANSYGHIAGTSATSLKSSLGILHTLAINTPAAGTVSLFDLGSAACTGTPSTNTVAVVTVGASDPAKSINYDASFSNGICVKASAAMDLTATFN